MPRYQPVRVRAYLQTPVIADAFLPLDGVLAYIARRRKYGFPDASLPGESLLPDGEQLPNLPLDHIGHPLPSWYYACSFAQWPEMVEGVDHWNKRLDQSLAYLVDFGGKSSAVDISAGKYKAYHMPVFYRHALYVDWYAMATPDKLRRLLVFATHLGKKVSQGWGAVLRWEVEDWHADWSVRDDDGRLMRAIPADNQPNAPVLGVRPSYWNPRHQFPCQLPG